MSSLGRAITIADLTTAHLVELRRLRDNPRTTLQPARRNLYVRLGLIHPTEGPRAPRPEGCMMRPPPPRAFDLTAAGLEVLRGAS